jgi:hypothetical protein
LKKAYALIGTQAQLASGQKEAPAADKTTAQLQARLKVGKHVR